MPGVSCSSRHSLSVRAPTPGGSSRCTTRERFFGDRQSASRDATAASPFSSGGERRQQLFERRLQVAVRVEAVDDPLGHPPHRVVELEPAELMVQVVDERLGPGQHVGHRVVPAVAFLLDAIERRPATLLVVVRQILGHVQQPLEVVLVVRGRL